MMIPNTVKKMPYTVGKLYFNYEFTMLLQEADRINGVVESENYAVFTAIDEFYYVEKTNPEAVAELNNVYKNMFAA